MERVSLVDLLWSTDICDDDFYRTVGIDSTTWVDWAFGKTAPTDAQRLLLAKTLDTTVETIDAAVFAAQSGIFEVNYLFQQKRLRLEASLRQKTREQLSPIFRCAAVKTAKPFAQTWMYTLLLSIIGAITGVVVGLITKS